MIEINTYTNDLKDKLKDCFGDRLVYMGLQGSYLRDEATEESDIDIMVVWDRLHPNDLEKYREILISLGKYDLACGFVCDVEDLKNWNSLEVCHLLHTTKDLHGRLAELLPPYSRADIVNYIKLSVGNLYHELCHRRIHGNRENIERKLAFMYKSTFFILQNLVYLRCGEFCNSKAELEKRLSGADSEIMVLAKTIRDGGAWAAEEALNLLFYWCKGVLKTDEFGACFN